MNCLPDIGVSRTKLVMMYKFLTALFACLIGLSATAQTEAIQMPTAPLTIVTQAEEVTILAEIADDPFLGEDGDVLTIVSHVQANSERRINPGFPVKGVVELAAGQAKAFGIAPGDKVLHPIFANWVEADDAAVSTGEETPSED